MHHAFARKDFRYIIVGNLLCKTFGNRGFSHPWFANQHESVTKKDFFENLQGKLLIEISEMDAFNRAEVTRVFHLATGGMGLTEVRCLFLVANAAFYFIPPRPFEMAGITATYADFFGVVWIVVNVGLYVLTMIAELKKLAAEEPRRRK